MTVSIDKVQRGITRFIDDNITPTLGNWEKVGFCTTATLIIHNLPKRLEKIKNKPLVEMMGIIDDEGNIDIDALRDALAGSFSPDGESIDIPIIKQRFKFTAKDVDELCKMIKEA